jgi:starch-binding outer membrane protein, SusD/RagB family
MKKIRIIFYINLSILLVNCKKFVTVNPPSNQIVSETVFTSDATAIATMNGVYSQMMNSQNQFTSCLTSLYAGLYADELSNYTPSFLDEFRLSRISFLNHSQLQSNFWRPAYTYIYTANLVLEGLEKSSGLTPSLKEQLKGEALFVRAFCYFYLVNLFGDVPLVTQTNYLNSATLPRSSKMVIYDAILEDLKTAQQLLPSTFSTNERIRPTKWAATALLARTYLYLNNWAAAESEANSIINTSSFSLPSNLRQVFLKNSSEAIWQMQPVNPTFNTHEARLIVPTSNATLPTYVLSNYLINSFEPGDLRKLVWDTVRTYSGNQLHIPYKYKVAASNAPLTEYYMVLRLAEVVLIRAEARAQTNQLTLAVADVNRIRQRAGLSPLTATTKAAVLTAIESERRIELFAEWGHRFFDLKRNGKLDIVLGNIKSTWQSNAALWPIPQGEIDLNPRLTQNPGY